MQNITEVIETPKISEALKGVLEKSTPFILPEKRQDFERHVLEKREEFEREVLGLQVALIEELGRQTNTYCNGGWKDIKEVWLELHNESETLLMRKKLLKPADLKEFDAAIRWMAGRGMEAELDLLQEVKKEPPTFVEESSSVDTSEEICRLIVSAEQRIRERVSDPEHVMSRGEEAYQKNKEAWDRHYQGEFIAIHRGEVVAHNGEQAQLARQLLDLQREKGRFRAYVVEVGAPQIVARGPLRGVHRTAQREVKQS